MIYVFEDGRIVYGSENLYTEDEGKYISTEQLPEIVPITGKTGYYYSDLTEGKILIGYFDTPEPPEPVKEPLPEILPVTNEEVVQSVMYLTAMYDIAAEKEKQQIGIAPMSFGNSPRYSFWHYAYVRKHTNAFTLDSLVSGGVLTQEEVDGIVSDRLAKFGE